MQATLRCIINSATQRQGVSLPPLASRLLVIHLITDAVLLLPPALKVIIQYLMAL
jgi:hypothetical protein